MKVKRKKNAVATNGEETTTQEDVKQYDAPDGYEERTSDLVGFWNHELGPVHFVPLYAKAFDSHIEPNKPSVIVVGHSVDANKLVDSDGHEFVCASGDLIGVWYKPGMIRLKNLANIRVFMQYSGEQDTGKPNAMKTFKVMSREKEGSELKLQDDYRKKSKHIALPFTMRGARSNNGASDDDENFGDNSARRRARNEDDFKDAF